MAAWPSARQPTATTRSSSRARVSTLARTDPELIEVFDDSAKEVLYQAVPYVGMAKVFDFLHATNDVLRERGVELPLPGQSTTTPQTRSGLDLATRELLTSSMLVSLGGCEAQVAGHVAGNLHVGNTRARLLAVLTHLLSFIGYPRTLNGLRVLDEVAPAA